MTLADLTYYAYLLKNDFHHVHLHAGGPDFDKIHAISQELYEELEDEIDELAEMAIMEGCSLESFSIVNSFIDDSQWEPENETMYNWDSFVKVVAEKGGKYLDAIGETTVNLNANKSYLDEIERFWLKEINYKNCARELADKTYVDAQTEIEDSKEFEADDSEAEELENMTSDLVVTGGIEIDPLASTMFTSPYETEEEEEDDDTDTEESDDDEE